MYPKSLKFAFLVCSFTVITACGSGSGGNAEPVASIQPAAPSSPSGYWSPEIPDFSIDPDAPSIQLNGPDVVFLAIDEEYEELGAIASDPQDGDITNSVAITSNWNRFSVGDYFVRYQVSDSSGKSAIEKVRVIRVTDSTPSTMNLRPYGTTASHLGYIEALPVDYGINEGKQYSLLIFNHGNNANVEVSSTDPVLALNTIIRGSGPALMQQNGNWDSDLPMITLSPQMGGIGDGSELTRLNAFIDYALNTYAIDPSRIYITGWSQGGFLSLLYAAEYPERVAAVVSIAGGFPANANDRPANVCTIESVPIWAFHGDMDDIVSVNSSIESIEYLNQNCQMQTLPRLTVFQQQGHQIHHAVYSLSALVGGAQGITSDPSYDAYDIGLFDWMFQYQSTRP